MREASTLAHRGDPETSHDAARSLTGKEEVFAAILLILAEEPLTAEELEFEYNTHREAEGWPQVAYRSVAKRLSELHRMHKVVRTGERRGTVAGATASVWAVAS